MKRAPHWLKKCPILAPAAAFAALPAFRLPADILAQEQSAPDAPQAWRLSAFQCDVTPPLGHPLLAISRRDSRAASVADPLFAKGLVLRGSSAAEPIVLVAVDWCEIRNDAYSRWREVLAQAAETTPQRVLVTCLHQHDAPYFDLTAQKLIAAAPGGGMLCDPNFHESTVQRVAAALKDSLQTAEPITHVGVGKAKVEQIASNRRVVMPDGKATFSRYSRTGIGAVRDFPEGEIDPWLTLISFWHEERLLAEITAYATHPMSAYGAGEVSADFVGMARTRREQDNPGVFQMYLTGASGDVTAGKFNDGSIRNRPILADRLHQAMREASRSAKRHRIDRIECRSVPMLLPHSELPELQPEALRRQLADPQVPFPKRVHAALGLSSFLRNPKGHQTDLQVIDLGPALMVLLPAESFVAYQLLAQRLHPGSLVMGIGFGECAPGYIPTDQAFREGFREEHGYCWVAPGVEGVIAAALHQALARE